MIGAGLVAEIAFVKSIPLAAQLFPLSVLVGSLVALGCRSGVAKVFGFKLSGFPAWWLHRTVYLSKMPGFARKARVALDWTFDFIFAPAVVQLGVHRAGRAAGDDRDGQASS